MSGNGKHEYQVTRWATCPHCGGNIKGCQQCYYGGIEVKVDLLEALRDLGIIDQLGSQQVAIEELQTKQGVVAVLVDDYGNQRRR
jgi:copper chaperone CopZ